MTEEARLEQWARISSLLHLVVFCILIFVPLFLFICDYVGFRSHQAQSHIKLVTSSMAHHRRRCVFIG